MIIVYEATFLKIVFFDNVCLFNEITFSRINNHINV